MAPCLAADSNCESSTDAPDARFTCTKCERAYCAYHIQRMVPRVSDEQHKEIEAIWDDGPAYHHHNLIGDLTNFNQLTTGEVAVETVTGYRHSFICSNCACDDAEFDSIYFRQPVLTYIAERLRRHTDAVEDVYNWMQRDHEESCYP